MDQKDGREAMITFYGLNNRDQILNFQTLLLKRNVTPNSTHDTSMCSEVLGRNFSSFIYQKDGKKLLVLLDVDDGSGGTPSDCKIVWSSLHSILQKHKPHDMIVLKSQVNRDPEYNQFYPFKDDVYPIGIFSNDPDKVFERKKRHPQCEQDIDVFYAGGYKHSKNRPYVWPKNRDIRKWWSGSSVRGYEKLLEIKSRRQDIKIALFDDSVPADQFYSLMRRSKMCIDLPGIGLSSRKFYECMVFGKCVIALRQQFAPWPCEENEHYVSLGEDLDYETLEEKIDLVLKNDGMRKRIENNVENLQGDLRLDAMVTRVEKILSDKITSMPEKTTLQY